jgi:uncharacterized protein DUF6152
MKTLFLNICFAVAIVAMVAGPARAHHSFAMYDMTQTKTATGKLIRFIPGANHAQLHFELLDADGKPVVKDGKPSVMGVETGSAAQLARQGVTVDEFPVGTVITVAYHPLRDGRPLGALAGELIRCGKTLPKGGCTKATGQVFLTGNSQ